MVCGIFSTTVSTAAKSTNTCTLSIHASIISLISLVEISLLDSWVSKMSSHKCIIWTSSKRAMARNFTPIISKPSVVQIHLIYSNKTIGASIIIKYANLISCISLSQIMHFWDCKHVFHTRHMGMPSSQSQLVPWHVIIHIIFFIFFIFVK